MTNILNVFDNSKFGKYLFNFASQSLAGSRKGRKDFSQSNAKMFGENNFSVSQVFVKLLILNVKKRDKHSSSL